MPPSPLLFIFVTQISFAVQSWDSQRLIADELLSLKVEANRAALLVNFHRDLARELKVDEATEQSAFVREAVFITWREAVRRMRVNKGTPGDLEAKLLAYLDKARPHFSKLSRRELDRDWSKLRGNFNDDREWIFKELNSLLRSRPVIVLDAGVGAGVREAAKSEDHWREAVVVEVTRVVGEVLSSEERRLGDLLESVGGYAGPLTPEQRKRFSEQLRLQMVEEPVVVLFSTERLRLLVRSLVNGTELKLPPLERRLSKWGTAFEDLALTGPGALFIGDVPADFRSGKRLGSSMILHTPGNAGRVPDLPRQQWWSHWNQTLNSWTAGLMSCIRCEDTLHERVLSERMELWQRKVEKLEEFAGSMVESELSWDELDRQLLAAVRQARRELPLFTDHDRSAAARSNEFRAFLHSSHPAITALVEEDRKNRWESIDRRGIDQFVSRLREWSLSEYERRFTIQDIRDNHITIRADELLNWVDLEVRVKTELAATKNFRLWEFNTLKRLNGKRLLRETPATEEELADCSEFERAFYDFFRATLASAPMFTELDRRYTEDDFRIAHDRFKAQEFAKDERAAYDRLFPLMEQQLRYWMVPRPAPVMETPSKTTAVPKSQGSKGTENISHREQGTATPVPSERPTPFALSEREHEQLAATRWTNLIMRQLPLAAVGLLTLVVASIWYRRRVR